MENNKRRGSEERIVLAHPTMVYDKDRRFHHPMAHGMGNNQTQTMIQLLIKGAYNIRGPKGDFFRG